MPCDHVVGSHGATLIRHSEWSHRLGQFALAVHFFNTTTAAVPHPGFVRPHAFCCDCGARLNLVGLRASLSEALSVAIDAVLGTNEHPPQHSFIGVPEYMNWLAGIDQPVAAPQMARIAHTRT